jgi:HEAT repeat protein
VDQKGDQVNRESASRLPVGFFSWTAKERKDCVHALAADPVRGKSFRDAAGAWYSSGDPQLVTMFAEIAERDKDVGVRRAAFAALANIPDATAIPWLVQGLQSTDHATQYHVIAALGRLRAREAVPALVRLLGDRRLKIEAARALAAIGDERAVEPLRVASLRGSPVTRARVRACLKELQTSIGD